LNQIVDEILKKKIHLKKNHLNEKFSLRLGRRNYKKNVRRTIHFNRIRVTMSGKPKPTTKPKPQPKPKPSKPYYGGATGWH